MMVGGSRAIACAVLTGVALIGSVVHASAARDTCNEAYSSTGEHVHAGEQNGADTPDVCFGGNHSSGTIERFEVGGGNDTVHARDGVDLVYGGEDADNLYGMAGADEVYGQWGDDHISGGNSSDTVDGAGGNDVIHGDDGSDSVYGGDSAHNLQFDSPDFLRGDSGNDGLIDRCCNGDHENVCGGTGDDGIDILDGDSSDLAFDKDRPTMDVGDGWHDQNACSLPENGTVSGVNFDGLQATLDGLPDTVVEAILDVLDLVDVGPAAHPSGAR